MTDQDLIHELRNSKGWPTLGNAAADRIEALIAERDRAAQEARAVALQEAADTYAENDGMPWDYFGAAYDAILALIDTPAAEALERVRAEERGRVLDKVSEKWALAIYGATENGVAWLNDKADSSLDKAYPDLSAFGDWLTDAAIRAQGET